MVHTDAVQAFSKVTIDAQKQQFDLLTISGHKFSAPKGIGALFIRRGTHIEPLMHGGTQDRGGDRALRMSPQPWAWRAPRS